MAGRSAAVRVTAAFLFGIATTLASLGAQAPTAAEHLKAGIAHIEAGDFLLGVMTLNEVIEPAAGATPTITAQAHVYRAQAYVELKNQERARAAAMLALDAQPGVEVTAPPYSPAVVALFADVRRTASLEPEAAGAAAEKAGHFEEAFRAYVRAYQSLPEPPSLDADRRLRERIIDVSLALPSEPAMPKEAAAHFAKATQLIEAEALLGGSVASSEAAATELRRAIRLAPWWPEATLKLATVLQKLQRVEEALMNLGLYRAADPVGYAAATAAKTTAAAPARVPPPSPPAAAMPSTASVYIYWPPQSRNNGRPKVYCDGVHVADLQNKRFVLLDVNPGTHEIRFDKKTISVAFEAGGKYYLRASAEGHMQFAAGRTVRQVTAEEGAAEMHDEGVTSNDPRRTYATGCAAPKPAARGKG